MNDLDDLWRHGLEAEALTIDLTDPASTGPGPAVIERRGRRRRHRNHAAVAVSCAALLTASGLAWRANNTAGHRPTELRVADEGDTIPPLPGTDAAPTVGIGEPAMAADLRSLPPVTLVPSPLAWSSRPVPYGQGISHSMFGPPSAGAAGGLVALSTQPGVASRGSENDALTFYTSTDGVTWKQGGTTTGRHWFGAVTPTARGLVAVGTAAATGPITVDAGGNGAGDLVVATSTDGGRNWRDVVLPLDLRALYAKARANPARPFNIAVNSAQIVAAPNGTLVAAVSLNAGPAFDIRAALGPDGDLGYGTGFGPDGVAVYKAPADPEQAAMLRCAMGTGPCSGKPVTVTVRPVIDHVVPWTALGVDPAVGALTGGTVHVLRSDDGTIFTDVPVGAFAGIQQLVATTSGFALVGTPRPVGPVSVPELRILTSADAITWAAAPTIPLDAGYTVGAGAVGDRLVIAGMYKGWPAIATLTGDTWALTSLANGLVPDGAIAEFSGAALGPAGAALAISAFHDPTSGLTFHASGITLRSDGSRRGIAILDDTTGTELGRIPSPYAFDTSSAYRIVGADGRPSSGAPSVATTIAVALNPDGSRSFTLEPTSRTTTTVLPGGTYEVRAGDTAQKVADSVGVPLNILVAANPGIDKKLTPGDRIIVPIAATAPATASTTTTVTGQAAPGGEILEVLDPKTGNVRARFQLNDIRAAWEAAANNHNRNDRRALLVTSTDLANWSLTDIGTTIGVDVSRVVTVTSTTAGITATVETTERDPNAPTKPDGGVIVRQVAVLGTAR